MYVFVSVYVHEIISKKSKTQNYARISQFVYVHELLKKKNIKFFYPLLTYDINSHEQKYKRHNF